MIIRKLLRYHIYKIWCQLVFLFTSMKITQLETIFYFKNTRIHTCLDNWYFLQGLGCIFEHNYLHSFNKLSYKLTDVIALHGDHKKWITSSFSQWTFSSILLYFGNLFIKILYVFWFQVLVISLRLASIFLWLCIFIASLLEHKLNEDKKAYLFLKSGFLFPVGFWWMPVEANEIDVSTWVS